MSRVRKPRTPRATLHIAAGRWKRKSLESPPDARPTGGRAREALFDILQKRVPGARVLDLYAGSGALGLEAVSRGAERAVLVEIDAGALARNVQRLEPGDGEVEVLKLEAGQALTLLSSRGERFEIVFADPPYAARVAPGISRGIAALLAAGGSFVLQTDAGDRQPPAPEGLVLRRRRAYGRNVFWFFAVER